jgi:hypothetical protein
MSEYAQQLKNVCAFNRRLAHRNVLVERKLRSAELRIRQLGQANTALAAEQDAINTVLGAAMDAALETKRR